jgi:hypothetical protein
LKHGLLEKLAKQVPCFVFSHIDCCCKPCGNVLVVDTFLFKLALVISAALKGKAMKFVELILGMHRTATYVINFATNLATLEQVTLKNHVFILYVTHFMLLNSRARLLNLNDTTVTDSLNASEHLILLMLVRTEQNGLTNYLLET